MSRSRRVAVAVLLLTAAGAGLRFYGLDWGAPYHHFHIDEHFVFAGALELRTDFWNAGQAPKFFMYSPLPMYALIGLMEVREWFASPLDLTGLRDGVTFMVMGRAISAAAGTATIPLVFLIGRRVAGPAAGVIAAALLAVAPLHVRDSHFFSVDASLTFFGTLTWYLAIRMAAAGRLRDYVLAGVAFGGAVLSKYSAAFLAAVLGVAHLVAPGRVRWPGTPAAWARWAMIGALPGVVGVVTFFALDPHVVIHYEKFRQDLADWVTQPLTGTQQFVWAGHFTGIQPQAFWFTNLLFWGLGPAFEVWALAGVVWLAFRRQPLSWVALAFPLAYWASAGQTTLPFARYAMPLMPALSVTAAVLSADLLARPRARRLAIAATAVVIGSTTFYTLAYMNIYRAQDARLAASEYLIERLPAGASILVEPSHNIPPTGDYLTSPDFHGDYVLWGAESERVDHFRLIALDTYRYLYNPGPSEEEKRAYIERRLAMADYIVMDDTYLQFYAPLSRERHGAVKDYYDRLFSGRTDFQLLETFKVYPKLAGVEIDDDAAELSFRLFDHPRVFVFMRTRRGGPGS